MNGRRIRRAVSVLAAAVAISLAAQGAILAHAPDPILGGKLWAQEQAVGYSWRSGQVPPAWMQAAIDAGAGDSNASRASRAAAFSRVAGAASLIAYGEPASCSAAGIACADRSGAPKSFRIWVRAQGYAFDWGTLRWCQAPGGDTNGCYDAESVALHEFGHIQVLGHHEDLEDESDWADTVMHTVARAKPKAGYAPRAFGRCDTARLQLEYDRPASDAFFSSCLSLATVLTLSASPVSASLGESVRFNASLRTASGAALRALSNDPISGRVVWLQRRTPGTSSWTTIATMTPSGGSDGLYSATWSPTASYDWRAVFATPPGEGISGSTSSVISVIVSGCGNVGCPQSVDR